LVALWAGYFQFVKPPSFMAAAVAVALYSGLLNLYLAWMFFKYSDAGQNMKIMLSTCLLVSGLHWLDYPFLRYVDNVGEFGFLF
jgi:ABC-type polysaccharide/polyol phosphate export permease